MKASIKFREDQKPLARAKIPLHIAGLPFQSGIVAGESKELSLNLATFFDSGPSLKLAYKPNDSLNPFTLVFRTGIGHYGSPINSPVNMSAEFNLIGTQNPRFFIHFKPKLGDFSIKKLQSSDFVKKVIKRKQRSNGNFSEEDILIESKDNGLFYGKRIGVLTTPESASADSLIGGLLSGMEPSANTVVPVMNRAVVNFRWGVRFSQGETAAMAVNRDATAAISVQQLPFLVMNKIGIEHVAVGDTKDSIKGSDGVADTYSVVKRQMELIQFENEMLRKTMNDLKSEFAASKWTAMTNGSGGVDLGKYREGERGVKPYGGRLDWRNNASDKKSSEYDGKASEGDANGELKKKVAVKDVVGA